MQPRAHSLRARRGLARERPAGVGILGTDGGGPQAGDRRGRAKYAIPPAQVPISDAKGSRRIPSA